MLQVGFEPTIPVFERLKPSLYRQPQWPRGLRHESWPLKHRDHGFESHSRHWYVSSCFCAILLCAGTGTDQGVLPTKRIHRFRSISEMEQAIRPDPKQLKNKTGNWCFCFQTEITNEAVELCMWTFVWSTNFSWCLNITGAKVTGLSPLRFLVSWRRESSFGVSYDKKNWRAEDLVYTNHTGTKIQRVSRNWRKLDCCWVVCFLAKWVQALHRALVQKAWEYPVICHIPPFTWIKPAYPFLWRPAVLLWLDFLLCCVQASDNDLHPDCQESIKAFYTVTYFKLQLRGLSSSQQRSVIFLRPLRPFSSARNCISQLF
jgi:hypothetical protein